MQIWQLSPSRVQDTRDKLHLFQEINSESAQLQVVGIMQSLLSFSRVYYLQSRINCKWKLFQVRKDFNSIQLLQKENENHAAGIVLFKAQQNLCPQKLQSQMDQT